MATEIHPTAIVDSRARLGTDVWVGPFATVGPKVELGDGVMVHHHALVQGRTRVGSKTVIHPFASVGMPPQDLKYTGEDTELHIGERNQIREYTNISVGTAGGHGRTVIGSDNLVMVYSHIAHDCILGNQIIMANGVSIAGHVEIHDSAVLGGMAGVHQFVRIGSLAMVAAGSMVAQDVPPYCMVQGDRASLTGLNVVGLRRREVSPLDLTALKAMYRIVFDERKTLEDALSAIEREVEPSRYRDDFVSFLRRSRRGICR